MKKYSRIFPLVAILLMAATGCVQPVEIQPSEEREVFVKCILEKGKEKQQAILLYSGGIGDERFDPVMEAEVVLSGPTRSYPRTKSYPMHHIGDGVYEAAFEPIDGGAYTLQAFIPGRDTLEAVTTMPQAFSISSHIVPPEVWLEEGNDNQPDLNPWAFFKCHQAYEQMKASGGRSLLSEMPGLLFRLDSLSHHHLYVLGRMEDASGVVAPIIQLATNHRLVDNVNVNGKKYGLSRGAEMSAANPRERYDIYIKQGYAERASEYLSGHPSIRF